MSRYVEPRAPTELNELEIDTLKTHPHTVKLRQLRDSLSQALRDEYGTIAKANRNGDVRDVQESPRCFTVCKCQAAGIGVEKNPKSTFRIPSPLEEINDQLEWLAIPCGSGELEARNGDAQFRRTKMHRRVFMRLAFGTRQSQKQFISSPDWGIMRRRISKTCQSCTSWN